MVRSIEWADRGVWLRADLHTHTRFSDGGHTVEAVAAAATKYGCDVLAISDHGDDELKAATPEYYDAIRKTREQFPKLVIMAGLEWNIPPGKGDEHAIVLFPSAMENVETVGPFKSRFDDWKKIGENAPLALEALTSLRTKSAKELGPVALVNHPSRRPESTSAPSLTLEALHRSAPLVLVGFEGAPGHQRTEPLGSYERGVKPMDRWDPFAAEVGGQWDRWSGKGLDLWGALANSDFHHESGDFWPCEFSSTWIYAPDRTGDGVIRAMRAGSFFGEHGSIATEVRLSAQVPGLTRPAVAGETASAPVGTKIVVTLNAKPTPTDYLGRPSQIDQVELIGIAANRSEVLFSGKPSGEKAFAVDVAIPAGGIVVRARGKRMAPDGQTLLFYTNPIRLDGLGK
jgi:hypothetical protein